jgi:hypothetical protein
MTEDVLGLLSDWTGQQSQMCTLLGPIDSDDLAFQIDDVTSMGARGLVEVDEELIYVSAVDQTSGLATVPAWGRGQLPSVAAAHVAGARVTTAPRPPRARVKRSLNQAILGLYPDLWAVATSEVPATVATEYPLPVNARWIVDMTWETPVAPSTWERVRAWRINTTANSTDFPTGVSVSVFAGVPVGQTIRVVYGGEPVQLVAGGDDFATVSGLHEGVADLVVMTAAARLVLAADLSRSQLSTVEQNERSVTVPASASLTASRFLRDEYRARVLTERRRLLAAHPGRPHFEGI